MHFRASYNEVLKKFQSMSLAIAKLLKTQAFQIKPPFDNNALFKYIAHFAHTQTQATIIICDFHTLNQCPLWSDVLNWHHHYIRVVYHKSETTTHESKEDIYLGVISFLCGKRREGRRGRNV